MCVNNNCGILYHSGEDGRMRKHEIREWAEPICEEQFLVPEDKPEDNAGTILPNTAITF